MEVIRHRSVRAGGHLTALLEAGNPDAPTVVLLHDGAFGTDAGLCWRPVIELLAGDHYVLAPDLLGWGGSDKICYFDRSPYDFRLEHIRSILDVLAIDDPVGFVGTSFGAELAVRGTAEPRWGWNVTGTIAISGTGGRLFRTPGGIEQLSDYVPNLEAARRLTSFFVLSTDGMDEHVRQRYENSLTPGHWEALSALRLHNPSTERMAPIDPWPEPLRACSVPIHFVEGAGDPLLDSGWAEQMAAIADHGSWEVVDGSHEPNLDRPIVIADLIKRFFRMIG